MVLNEVPRAALAGLVYFGSIGSAAAFGPQDCIASIGLIGSSSCQDRTLEARGQLLKIAKFTLLCALIGNTFDGDGKTTFALPNLTAAVPVAGTRYRIVVLETYPPKP